MTNDHRPRTVEKRGTNLSFAVLLRDVFTGGRPDADVDVRIDSALADSAVNPSGFHVFLDVEAESVTLTVDGGDDYVDQEWTVVLSGSVPDTGPVFEVSAPSDPLVVELTPTPAYEFPDTTTVIRGHVEDADGTPIDDATVTLQEFDPVVETTTNGEFALFVPATADQVMRRDGRNVVVVDDGGDDQVVTNGGHGTDPTLEVTHPSHDDAVEQLEVESGTRNVHYVTLD
jgi:hypothetical protein